MMETRTGKQHRARILALTLVPRHAGDQSPHGNEVVAVGWLGRAAVTVRAHLPCLQLLLGTV